MPELATTDYPPRDLLLRRPFLQNRRARSARRVTTQTGLLVARRENANNRAAR